MTTTPDEDDVIEALRRLGEAMRDPAQTAALEAALRQQDEQYERWLFGEPSSYDPPPYRAWPMRGGSR